MQGEPPVPLRRGAMKPFKGRAHVPTIIGGTPRTLPDMPRRAARQTLPGAPCVDGGDPARYTWKGTIMGKRVTLVCLLLSVVTAGFGASTFFDNGEALFVQNKPQDARPLLESALNDDPANEKTYLYLGIIYQQLGDAQKAINVLNRGLGVAASWKDLFYYNIGNDLFSRKDYATAADMYSKAVAVNKDLPDAYLNRANARLQLKGWDGALADYTLYLQLRPQDPQRPSIEKIIGLLRQAQDDAQRAAQADADKQKALMDEILKSLNNAGDDTKNLSVESIKGQTDPVNVDIKD